MTDVEDAIWVSLPVPAVIVAEDDTVLRLNPAAEAFLLSSSKTMLGQPIWDRLAVDAPLEQAMERARETGAPLFVNDVDIGTGARAPVQCNLQIAPVTGAQGSMLILN